MTIRDTLKTKRRELLKGTVGVAAASLAAPFVLPARAAGLKIRFGIIPAYSFGLYWVAQEQGFLEEPGIELDMTVFPSGPPAIEAMVAGDVDVITVGSVPPLVAMNRNEEAQFREISICADASGLFTVMAAPQVKSLADLQGGKIAVTANSNFDYFLDKVLDGAGLKDMLLTRVDMQPLDGQAAFIAGEVDAVVPLATSQRHILSAREGAHVVVDGSQLPPRTRPSIMDVVMTTQPYIDANRDSLVGLVRAFHGPTISLLRSRNDLVVDDLLRWQAGMGRDDLTAEDVEPILNGYFYFDKAEIKREFDGGTLERALTVQSEFLVNTGQIDRRPNIGALVTDEIVNLI